MFDEYFQASTNVDHLVSEALSSVFVGSTGSSSSISIDQDEWSRSITQTTHETQSPVIPQGVVNDYLESEVAHLNNDPLLGISRPSRNVVPSNVHSINQPQEQN